LQAEKLITAI